MSFSGSTPSAALLAAAAISSALRAFPFSAASTAVARYAFAVTLRAQDAGSENTLIGTCFLSIRPDELRQGELTYLYARPFWGHGYATEAARAVLEVGFRELDLHRIYATCRPANMGSARVLEKLGMRREGHLVQHRWMKGSWQDSLLYAILDHEWQAQCSTSM